MGKGGGLMQEEEKEEEVGKGKMGKGGGLMQEEEKEEEYVGKEKISKGRKTNGGGGR